MARLVNAVHISNNASSAASENPLVPPEIDGYEIQALLGRGGMGAVYQAVQLDLQRNVAIKILDRIHCSDPEMLQKRFSREARITARLDHTSIVPVFNVGTDSSGRFFYTMRSVSGRTLSEIFRLARDEREGWNQSRALGVMVRVCQTIAFAHSQRIVHRDIKPSNVMVGDLGDVYVLDWGLAVELTNQRTNGMVAVDSNEANDPIDPKIANEVSFFDDEARQSQLDSETQGQSLVSTVFAPQIDHSRGGERSLLTIDGTVLGTPSYMSPEQASGNVSLIGTHSDIYSLGAILYELLAGCSPFHKERQSGGSRGVIAAVLQREPTSVLQFNREVAPGLLAICQKAMARSIDQRYESSRSMAEDLQAFLDQRVVQAYQTGAIAGVKLWIRRNRGLAAAVSLAFFFAIMGLTTTALVQWKAKKQLTEVNAEIQTTLVRESREKDRATAASHRAQSVLADMYTSRGLRLENESRHNESLLWYAEAAIEAENDPTRYNANLLRARNAAKQATVPVGAFMINADYLHDCHFLDDGRQLLIHAGDDVTIRDWSTPDSDPTYYAKCTAVCPNVRGDQVAVGRPDGRIEILGMPAATLQQELQMKSAVSALCHNESTSTWAFASGNQIRLWRSEQDDFFGGYGLVDGWIDSVTFSPDGKRLAVATKQHQAFVFEIDANGLSETPVLGPVPHRHIDHTGPPRGPVFFDRGSTLVCIPVEQQLSFWDIDSEPPSQPRVQNSQANYDADRIVSNLAADRFATISNHRMEVYHAGAKGVANRKPHSNAILAVALSSDGTLLTAGREGLAQLADFDTGDSLSGPMLHEHPVRGAAISNDARYLAMIEEKGLVRIWKRQSEKVVRRAFTHWGRAVRLSADGTLVSPGFWNEDSSPEALTLTRLRVVDARSGDRVGTAIDTPVPFRESCVCSGNEIVAIAWNRNELGFLAFFEIKTGKPVCEPLPMPTPILSIDAHPTAPQVAVLHHTGVQVIDLGSSQRLHERHHPKSDSYFNKIRYSRDGTKMLMHRDSHTIQVVDASSGASAPLLMQTDPASFIRTFETSSDDRWLAIGAVIEGRESAVVVFDLSTGRQVSELLRIPGGWFAIFDVAFSPDGKYVAAGGNAGEARCWDWQTGRPVCSAMTTDGEIFSLAFTPQGYLITVASRCHDVWDIRTGSRVLALHSDSSKSDYAESHCSAILTPDGNHLVGCNARSEMLGVTQLHQWLSVPQDTLGAFKLLGQLASSTDVNMGKAQFISSSRWFDHWKTLCRLPDSPQIQPDDWQALMTIYAMTGNWRSMIRLANEFPQSAVETAEHLMQARRWDEAIEVLNLAIERTPADSTLVAQRAKAFIGAGRYEQAAIDLQQSRANETWVIRDVYDQLRRQNLIAPAAQTGLMLLERETDDMLSVWQTLAPMLVFTDREEDYRTWSSRIASRFSDVSDPEIASTVCFSCALIPSTDILSVLPVDALVNEPADKRGPTVGGIWTTRALMAYRRGKLEQAKECLDQAIAHGPWHLQRSICMTLQAAVACASGRAEEAKEHFRNARIQLDNARRYAEDNRKWPNDLEVLVQEVSLQLDRAATITTTDRKGSG
ncbi:protein kinase domain-containing protein [Stieleria varia]|uniref:protein kinase domain-containing protein n=1 Tax=Stieleria varia TaxID=2528005 RepID=UPI0018D1F781|nr:protein kinase [Stieleria varia]